MRSKLLHALEDGDGDGNDEDVKQFATVTGCTSKQFWKVYSRISLDKLGLKISGY